jgi:hypothetical protein
MLGAVPAANVAGNAAAEWAPGAARNSAAAAAAMKTAAAAEAEMLNEQ